MVRKEGNVRSNVVSWQQWLRKYVNVFINDYLTEWPNHLLRKINFLSSLFHDTNKSSDYREVTQNAKPNLTKSNSP